MQIPHTCNNGTSFVLASARYPAAIELIISNYGLTCSIIAFSGGLILDENRSVLYEKGFTAKDAACTRSDWIVKDPSDPRVLFYHSRQ
ncbi:HAD hydrolase family protein [[Ruminococcus] lactaris]|uniref:HAD hydrolase family protein n=1 Tax=[Ruminococcus] lactaris TaxID=46228 RepID=UPI000403633C|nr:HAD hydrolase family protein [[Ruminococcus] lactaris]